MDTGLVDRAPRDRSERHVDRDGAYAHLIQYPYEPQQPDDQRQGVEVERVRIEDGDDRDCADVVDDSYCQQQDTQADGDTRAEKRHDADRNCDVGGHRDRPAFASDRVINDEYKNKDRNDHPAERGRHRSCQPAEVGEFADHDLALDLEADDEEEEHHRHVVDPEVQVPLDGEEVEVEREFIVDEVVVASRESGVRGDQGQHDRADDDEPAGGLEPGELLKRPDEAHGASPPPCLCDVCEVVRLAPGWLMVGGAHGAITLVPGGTAIQGTPGTTDGDRDHDGARESGKARRVGGHWCPREDSNLRARIRNPQLYPLSYEGACLAHRIYKDRFGIRMWEPSVPLSAFFPARAQRAPHKNASMVLVAHSSRDVTTRLDKPGVIPAREFLSLFELVAAEEDGRVKVCEWRPRSDSNRRSPP